MTLDLDDPIALMLAAAQAFERAGLRAAAYGGLAVGMYGEARETRDADLAVASVSAEGLLDREVELLAGEITDHDVRGRYAAVTR